MDKSTNDYETSKILVDFYNPQKDDSFICSCYTVGAPCELEPEYLVKTVTYNELKEHIADGSGRVNISLFQGEGKYITFEKYISDLGASHIMHHCADIINKREHRTHLFNRVQYDNAKSSLQTVQP